MEPLPELEGAGPVSHYDVCVCVCVCVDLENRERIRQLAIGAKMERSQEARGAKTVTGKGSYKEVEATW